MRLKVGVTVNGVQPETVVAMLIAETVYQSMGYDLTITSLTDYAPGRKPNTLHTPGLAFDCRIWDIPERMLETLVAKLREALGDEFDVVLKSDHIHIEFDPKNGQIEA